MFGGGHAPDAPRGIVVGVDGSPASHGAVRWAARDAELRNVALTVVHVLPDGAGPQPGTPDARQREQQVLAHQVISQALTIVDACCRVPMQVHCEIPSAHVVSALLALSRKATMLVVGRRGSVTAGGPPLGSVSSALVHHARCPVAVIHDTDPPLANPEQAPVLVGIDGSRGAEYATEIAFDEASRRTVGLVALHTWSDVSVFDDTGFSFGGKPWAELKPVQDEILAERLAGWSERYPEVPVRRVVARSKPARELVDQSQWAQLVVVGSHGLGGFGGMLLGSVTAAVVQLVQTPLIVARRPRT